MHGILVEDNYGHIVEVEHIEDYASGNLIPERNGSDRLEGTQGDDTLKAGRGIDALFGLGGADILFGGDGDDFLDGGAGDDSLFGGRGNDTLHGGSGDDELFGDLKQHDDLPDQPPCALTNPVPANQIGNDRLYGGEGNDILRGGGGHDYLDGGDGMDKLVGGAGDDMIRGGKGNDQLFGNDGNDIFIWRVDDLDGQDRVRDFDLTCDKLRFENIFSPGASTDAILARLSLRAYAENSNYIDINGNQQPLSSRLSTDINILSDDGSTVLHQIQLFATDFSQGGTLSDQAILHNLIEQGSLQFA
jgi:Ca2+-binding RTX toxin-like protein